MDEQESSLPPPLVLARAEHTVSRALISENALKVLYRLHRSGFLAYLVGGAVRDLMLDRRPKDFDIGTNARPQQVRQLFRNARLIGRRFRLARLTFADEVVEVATFRRSPEPPEMEDGETADVLAPIPEAEEFGTPEEDAWRRDFTVNGMFYNIADFTVIDHVGGLADLNNGVIRTIGAPRERFAEDPVRMMRAVEYAARLGFRIDNETAIAIDDLKGEIRRAAPARIAYELGESLRGERCEGIFRGLAGCGLLPLILPRACQPAWTEDGGLLWRFLAATDKARANGHGLKEEVLLAVLFLPGLLDAAKGKGTAPLEPAGIEIFVRESLNPTALELSFSNYRGHLLRMSYLCLVRLLSPPRSPRLVLRTFRHEGFEVAWQLANLLVEVTGERGAALASWRTALQRVQAGLSPLEEHAPAPQRRGARRRRRGGRRTSRRGQPPAAEATNG